MTHQELEQLLAPYALGALEDADRAQVETHLRRCPSCRHTLQDDLETLAAIPMSLGEVQPSPAVKAKLFQRIESLGSGPAPAARRRPLWRSAIRAPLFVMSRPWALASVSLAVAVLSLAWAVSLQLQTRDVEQRTDEMAQANTRLTQTLSEARQALYWSISPAVQRMDWRSPSTDGPSEWGNVLVSRSGNTALLMGANLTRSAPGGVYQVWIINDQGQLASVGYLKPDTQGWGQLYFRTDKPMQDYKSLAITIEPQPGLTQPAGTQVAKVDFR
ncbi:MAG: anti-sigma factor [Chloroflexi bacterium]|nr:anti-sigma factor [Chloroflexota bacterium]